VPKNKRNRAMASILGSHLPNIFNSRMSFKNQLLCLHKRNIKLCKIVTFWNNVVPVRGFERMNVRILLFVTSSFASTILCQEIVMEGGA
jgi:hypothetical protein